MTNVQILTAKTDAGREAIKTVMAASYEANIDAVPPGWALARVVAGKPVEDWPAILDDVLLVTDVKAKTWEENKTALQAAATLAHERNKAQILFEYPPAPSYGSRYSIYTALDTPLTTLARLCGAQICVQGADPESGSVPDADWIKVLDVAGFLGEAVACLNPLPPLPTTTVTFHTEAGTATLGSWSQCVHVSRESRPEAIDVHWPTSALAQLVTGYQPIETLCVKYDTQLKDEERSLSNSLFPPVWRLSRNESWTYKP